MQKENQYKLIVEADEEGLRLDQFLSRMLTAQSRSYLQKLVKQGNIFVNGSKKKSSYEVRIGDEVVVDMPEPVKLNVLPEEISLNILYEDEDLLVIDKSPGIVAHPAAGHFDHTLVNALLYHCGNSLSGIGGVLRPGIVHRLDKDTSGCMVVAKNDSAHKNIAKQFHDRTVHKEYRAIVSGRVKELRGKIETIIGRHPVDRKRMACLSSDRADAGREALTEYEVIERFEQATLVSLKLGTGRTHQIRVQMAHLGYPVLGDEEYGKKKSRLPGVEIKRQMLHAYKLGFTHPIKGEWMEFIAPIPEDMQELLTYIKEEKK